MLVFVRDDQSVIQKTQATLLLSMIRAVGLAEAEVPIRKFCGRVALSPSLTSYETTRWASMVLTKVAAKNRPGLQKNTCSQIQCPDSRRELLPCVFAVSEHQIFGASRGELVFDLNAIFGTHSSKSEGIKHLCIFIEFVVAMNRLGGHPNDGPFRYDCSVRKRDVLHGLSHHAHWQRK